MKRDRTQYEASHDRKDQEERWGEKEGPINKKRAVETMPTGAAMVGPSPQPILPTEIWTHIIFVQMAPEMVPFALLVCKEWRAALLSFLKHEQGRSLAYRLLGRVVASDDDDGNSSKSDNSNNNNDNYKSNNKKAEKNNNSHDRFVGASIMLAQGGHWRLLVWAVRQGILTWDQRVAEAAVWSGSLKTLKRVIRKGCPWEGYPHPRQGASKPHRPESLVIVEAARVGNLSMFKWLSKRSYRWDTVLSAMDDDFDGAPDHPAWTAALNGHVHILQWLADQEAHINDHSCLRGAILGGHLEAVRWAYLHHEDSPYYSMWNCDVDDLIEVPLRDHKIEVLRFLQEVGCFAIKADTFGTKAKIEAWFAHQDLPIGPALREWLDGEFVEHDRVMERDEWYSVYPPRQEAKDEEKEEEEEEEKEETFENKEC